MVPSETKLCSEANALEEQADRHFQCGDFHQALECQLQAASLRGFAGDKIGEANVWQSIGLIQLLTKSHAEALDAYQQALRGRIDAKDLHGQAVTLGRMGEVHQSLGNHANAVEVLARAIALFARVNGSEEIGIALNNMAVSFREMGKSDDAKRCYERSLELRRQANDFRGIAVTLHNLSVIYANDKNLHKAHELLKQALFIQEHIEDRRGITKTLLRLGMMYDDLRQSQPAIAYLERALSNSCNPDTRSLEDEVTALYCLGNVARSDGDATRALAFFKRAQAIATACPNPVRDSMLHYSLGRAYAVLDNVKKRFIILRAPVGYKKAYKTGVAWRQLSSQWVRCYLNVTNLSRLGRCSM